MLAVVVVREKILSVRSVLRKAVLALGRSRHRGAVVIALLLVAISLVLGRLVLLAAVLSLVG